MNFTKRKNKVIFKLKTIGTMVTLFAIKANMVFATEGASSGIGTAEVTQATDNIKRVITSIAMPLGRSAYFCQCCCSSNKNDCKLK